MKIKIVSLAIEEVLWREFDSAMESNMMLDKAWDEVMKNGLIPKVADPRHMETISRLEEAKPLPREQSREEARKVIEMIRNKQKGDKDERD